ncbi:MAG: YcjX family protein, partial [Acetobacteraceae bacterium]|nr:YcjX family protein [Acetobacteraceae bacterium]
ALDLDIGRDGLLATLPPQRLRLELLDYPGEWLLDIPMLGLDFAAWSRATLARLDHPLADGFGAFVAGLPAAAPADEGLARTGHELFRALLLRLRDEARLPFLQPGRFLMPPPGPEPPWMAFFPLPDAGGPLGDLLRRRYDAYRLHVRAELVAPSFGSVEQLVVLADVLGALHAGAVPFAQMREALGAVAGALRWRGDDWLRWLLSFAAGIRRVAFVATKADHVAERQRGNLGRLVRDLAATPAVRAEAFAIAAVRCTQDIVWTLEGRPVSAVRGRILGDERPVRSYPGEVPDRLPDAEFWTHPFLALPEFEPMRLDLGGRAGVPHIGVDALTAWLLEDVLP